MWKFKESKKKMESVMIYKKITELTNQYMIYNAVKNERKWEEKEDGTRRRRTKGNKRIKTKKM